MSKDDEFLAEARKRALRAYEAWETNFDEMDEDIEFLAGEQWPEEIKADREKTGRPCLTFNKLPQILDQVVGDQRKSIPAITVTPAQSNSKAQGVKIMNFAGTKSYSLSEAYEGIIRNIEYQSRAEQAYDTSFEHAAGWGLGYFRILTDYVDDESFDQDFIIKRVRNYKSVLLDPDFEEADGSDAQYGFIITKHTKADFERKYPKADTQGFKLLDGDQAPMWADGEYIYIAEYYYAEPDNYTLVALEDGQVMKEEDYLKIANTLAAKPVNSRPVKGQKISWCKMSGIEVLERKDTVFQWIPIIPVLGKELVIDGTPIYRGVIRHAKDPQRMYNYSRTADIERTALIPKAPYIGAAEQIDPYKSEWENANSTNVAVLRYKHVPGLPPPQRTPPVQTNPGEMNQSLQASEDIKATTGIYDASLGAKSNETSGKAINARKEEGDTGSFPYLDNLARSISHAGRIIVNGIPKLYDTERLLRIRFPDGKDDLIQINTVAPDGTRVNDLGVGKFDVIAKSGPGYSTQRAEAVDAMVQLIQANPDLWNVIGDLIAKNMDWPGAQEFEKRLRMRLPPEFLTEEERAELPPKEPDPAAIAAQKEAEANIKAAEAKAMEAQAKVMEVIERVNNLQEQIREQVAQAVAETILQLAQQGRQP